MIIGSPVASGSISARCSVCCKKEVNMQSKIVVITGANSGIGKEAALRFAKENHAVIMACRDMERGKVVLDEIIQKTGNRNVYLFKLDVSSFESIKLFADDFKNQFPKLDILINNAAYFNHGDPYKLNAEGIEIAFATNVAGPYLLILSLLDYLKKSDDPRVLNASSNIIKHFFSPKMEIDFSNIRGPNGSAKHSVYANYRNSKMAFLMLTLGLAEKYEKDGVKFFSLQINGARMSENTLRKFKPGWRLIARIQNLFFPHPSYMADNYFEICTSERYKNITGVHFNDKLEVMQKGPDKPSIKDIIGTSVYPSYAHRKDVRERVMRFCEESTSKYLSL
jgi:NAD(P)-dependent dehydrogenase (short-subunit alcohol dehydrogenase family)